MKFVLIVGLAAVIANSISVGISEFLSSKAHKEFIQAEKRRELWEFKNYKDNEILEVIANLITWIGYKDEIILDGEQIRGSWDGSEGCGISCF